MNSVIEIKSVAEWNTQLRSATASGKTVVADAKAAWCGPVSFLSPLNILLLTPVSSK